MSAERITYLYCDHPDCRMTMPPIEGGPGEPLWLIERRAVGWRKRNGKHLCSEHPADTPWSVTE